MSFGIVNITSLKGDSQGALSNLVLNGVQPGDTVYWNLYKNEDNGFRIYSDTLKQTLIAQTSGNPFWENFAVGPGASYVSDVENTASETQYLQMTNNPGLQRYDAIVSGTANSRFCIAWSPTLSLFCRVGASGEIDTSPTGDEGSWTSRTSGTVQALNYVMWDGTRFIAVGNTGTLTWSLDGITWTAFTAGVINLTCVCRNSGGIYVASAQFNGTLFCADDPTVAANWTGTFNAAGSFYSCVARGTLIVMVGENGLTLSSTDGNNWTIRNTPADANKSLHSIIDTGIQFIAGGDNRTIFTSANGTTGWIQRDYGAGSGVTLRLFEANGIVYGVGNAGLSVMSLTHGETWQNGPAVGTANTLRFGLSEGPTGFSRALIVGDSGTQLAGQFGFKIANYSSSANRTAGTPEVDHQDAVYEDQPITVALSLVDCVVSGLNPTLLPLNFDIERQAVAASNPVTIVAVGGSSVSGQVDIDTSKILTDDTN